MTLLERKVSDVLTEMGPGIYRIGVIVDAVNNTMRYPRWTARHVGEALRRHPQVKYIGRVCDHSAGSSLWQVVA